jgi:hypothetical protein
MNEETYAAPWKLALQNSKRNRYNKNPSGIADLVIHVEDLKQQMQL